MPTLTPFEALVALGETDPWWAPGTRLRPAFDSETGTGMALTAAGGDVTAACSPVTPSQERPRHAGSATPSTAAGSSTPEPHTDMPQSSSQPKELSTPEAEQRRRGAEVAEDADGGFDPYPMDYYARDGGVWGSSYHQIPAMRSKLRPELPTAAVS